MKSLVKLIIELSWKDENVLKHIECIERIADKACSERESGQRATRESIEKEKA